MIQTIEDSISRMTVEQITKLKRREFLCRLLATIFLIMIVIYSMANKIWWLIFCYFIVILLILIFRFWFRKALMSGITKILTEELKPKEARIAFETLYPKSNIIGKLNCSYSLLISGDFDESLKKLSSLKEIEYRRRVKNNRLFYDYYVYAESFLKILELEDTDLLNLEEITSSEISFSIKAISDIDSGLRNDYFVASEKNPNLDRLIANYYQAKNELLKGETERACELFQKVAVENDDIYFVREAKRILGELSHDRT